MITSNVNVNWVPGMTLEEIEKHCILAAFRWFRSNKTQTSISLGISIRTLENKLEKYEAEGKSADARSVDDKQHRTEVLNRMRGLPQHATNNTHRPIGQNSETPQDSYQAIAGVHMEPTIETSEKHAVPLPKQKEVQSVLSRQASPSGYGRKR